MNRGRPIGSEIRTNLIELLFVKGEGYGYQIHQWYLDVFGKVSQRSIYYHLKKGLLLKEFKLVKTRKVKGEYSWGASVERRYFGLGKSAKPVGILKK